MKLKKILAAASLLASLVLAVPVSAQAERKRPDPAGRYDLEMALHGTALKVRGGYPSDPCAIMLGLRETRFVLPGGALLSVVPLVILPVGEFDQRGEYVLDLAPLYVGLIRPVPVFAQAITVILDSEDFATSNVELLDAPDLPLRDGIGEREVKR